MNEPKIQCLNLGEEDLAGVAQIARRADPFGWTAQQIDQTFKSKNRFYGIRTGDVLCGYSIVLDQYGECELLEIAVDPDFQGQGLGKTLLLFTMHSEKARGNSSMHLEVRESNRRARALYEKAQFQTDGLRKNYYRTADGRENAVLMTAFFSI